MKREGHISIRTCMGCGERAPQRALVRLTVAATGALAVVCSRQLAAGRSGYLHDQPECWRTFAARKGRVRSLGRSIDRDVRLACVRELESARSLASTR